MDLVAAAPMGNLAPKLLQLLHDEYKLQKGVKAQVQSLADELESMHAALCKVAQIPYDQLDPQVKLWARNAREASYDMEDIIDTFLVRVHSCHHSTGDVDKGKVVGRLVKNMCKKFNLNRFKARHDIAGAIEAIKKQVDETNERRQRYQVDAIVASSPTSIDPRVYMTHSKASNLVDIDGPKDALVTMLTIGDVKKMKIVSIVGSGGLGKTTLAKAVYEKLIADMNIYCKAFVSIGQNPDLKKVFRDILLDLDKDRYLKYPNFMILDDTQLIKEIQTFLKEKRYFIVIDDVWEVKSWKYIKTVLEDNDMGSKIVMTTRISDVAELVHCIYKIKPLPLESSKKLFYGRIFDSPDMCPETLSEVSDKILKKCGGVPLAIITIASLLANKSDNIIEWQEVCNSIGSGLSSSNDIYNDMKKILLLSYYDLPSQVKTCFLYLSMYPEDYEIRMDQLIWRWICEGFIQSQRKGDDLFELGTRYFYDLINRSLVQPIGYDDDIYACRVHDMILDLICSLSREENFVTTSNDMEQVMSLEKKKLRRLSLKSTTWPKKGVSQVRCIVIFGSSIDSTSSFSCFHMLRVLDLRGCPFKDCEGSNKLYVGNLIHLRYLGLQGTVLKVLPRGIEKLQFLKVLKMDYGVELPEFIFGLSRLMCLEGVRCHPWSGNLLRNLASLQVLSSLYMNKDPAGTVKALGHLTQLVRLRISVEREDIDQSICDAFIDSLGNLRRLQYLYFDGSVNKLIRWERWTPPPHLREVCGIFSRTLPKWISPTSLPHLTYLSIDVYSVGPEDIQILDTLPSLACLQLAADHQNYREQPLQKFVVSADAFPRLRYGTFHHILTVPSMFTRGAMPLVEFIGFSIRAGDFFSNPGKGLDFDDLAMDHLPSLRTVRYVIYRETEEEAEKLREAVKHAAEVHPNHPELEFWYYSTSYRGGSDVTHEEEACLFSPRSR